MLFFIVHNAEHYYPTLFAGGTLIGLLEYMTTDHNVVTHYLIRRVLMEPSIINYFYYDFFKVHKPDFFQESILRRIGFVSEYSDLGIFRTIGKLYYHNNNNSVNNGLFSDAFANLGYAGLIIMPILIVIIIKIFQAVSYELPLYISLSCVFMIVFTIVSNSFFTFFITHGFVFLMIILYCWPRNHVNNCIIT